MCEDSDIAIIFHRGVKIHQISVSVQTLSLIKTKHTDYFTTLNRLIIWGRKCVTALIVKEMGK